MSRAVSLRMRARRTVRGPLGVPRAARYSLGWDILAGICNGAYQGLAFPFFAKIARGELQSPDAAIALLAAAPFLGNLLSPLWARQMEGRSKMPFVLGSWFAARFLLFLIPFLAGGPWGFVALIGGLQFIGTISSPAYTSLMRDIYPDRARGRLMSYVRIGLQTTMFIATMAAGRFLDHGLSFRILFPIAGVFGFGAAFAFSKVRSLPAPPKPPAPQPKDLGPEPRPTLHQFVGETLAILRDNEPFRWFAFSVFTYGFGNLMVQPLYQLFQVDVLHISGTQIANLANFSSLCSILGFIWWGRCMDHYGAARTVLYSIVCIALIPIVYLCAHTWYGLLFAAALAGFGTSGVELSYMGSILACAEPERTAQYQSLNSLLLGVRGVVAPLIGLPLKRALGYEKVFLLALAVMLVGCGMQYLATTATVRRSRSAS